MPTLFPGFTSRTFTRDGVLIHGVLGGIGDPLLLLHGYPETHLMWHKVAPQLAEHFTVVALDLRGYGDSGKPASDAEHTPYAKREMGRDAAAAMQELGYSRFAVVGHDRGARVAHRLALDAPHAVSRLAVLDMAPTLAMYEKTTMETARLWLHWFLLIQPADYPEHLIGADPEYFLRAILGRGPGGMTPYDPRAAADYLRCLRDPATVHAICEEFRASAGIDLTHDRGDRGRKLQMPVLAVWGKESILPRAYDVMALWREYAADLRGYELDCGHFLPEERPLETLDVLLPFLQE